MDGVFRATVEGADAVDGVACDVEQAAFDLVADGDGDGLSREGHGHATLQAVGGVHGDGAHRVLTDMLLTFKDELGAVGTGDQQGVMDLGQVALTAVEEDIDHGTDDLGDVSYDFF